MKTTVFGSGAWGTSVALLLHDNGYDVTLWSKFEEEKNMLRKSRKNPLLEGGIIPDDNLIISGGKYGLSRGFCPKHSGAMSRRP